LRRDGTEKKKEPSKRKKKTKGKGIVRGKKVPKRTGTRENTRVKRG